MKKEINEIRELLKYKDILSNEDMKQLEYLFKKIKYERNYINLEETIKKSKGISLIPLNIENEEFHVINFYMDDKSSTSELYNKLMYKTVMNIFNDSLTINIQIKNIDIITDELIRICHYICKLINENLLYNDIVEDVKTIIGLINKYESKYRLVSDYDPYNLIILIKEK